MPHLELIANHRNVNMGYNIYNALSKVVEVKQVYMWTDSQTALRWITKQFVRNRVRKINEKGQETKVKWMYCSTEDNPADVSTRGFKASQHTDKWWKGPDWLLDKGKWPEQPVIKASKLIEEERKQIKEIHLFRAVKTEDNIGNLITRKFYWSSLRITSWIFRFCHNALKKVRQEKLITGPITTEELKNARTLWILRAQKGVDPTADDVESPGLKKDDQGIYRCYGQVADEYPIFIPKDNDILERLIEHHHLKCLHGGISMTLSKIREDFWIPILRRKVKKLIRKCNICKVFASTPYAQPSTGLLPKCRSNVTHAFHMVGIDFIGPFICRKRKEEVKIYVIIITCALIRAVWLGVTKTMEVDELKGKLNQFISNHIRPSEIISDNARTFGAMAKWIKKIRKNEKLHAFLAKEEITWRFILSKEPWWGAMYERLIRDLKRTLFKVVGKTHITPKEFKMVIMDIQTQFNNRPITYVEDDLGPRTLTPNTILYTKDQHLLENDEDITNDDIFTKSERRIKLKREHMWRRWVGEYLRSLRERQELHKGKQTFSQIGEIVMIESESKNRREWQRS